MRKLGAVVALLACVAASCSSGGGKPTPAPGLVEGWRNETINPIGQPVHVGEALVVYATEGKDLFLYGVSLADGHVLWRQPASPSQTVSGSPLTPDVVDGHVAYFRPDPRANLWARLVVAAAESGNDLLVSEPMLFRSGPRHCADDTDICVTALNARGDGISLRFSVGAKGPVPDAAPIPAGSRYLGEDLLDLGERQPEQLADFHEGRVRWRAPVSRYFGPGYTSDRGWYFELYRTDQMHVGFLRRPPDRNDASVVVWDLSKAQTVGIEATTGVEAWRSDGTSFGCDAKITVLREVAEGRSEPWPVRCRSQGIATYDRATGRPTYVGLDVTLEGFEVPTGKTLWSVRLGPAGAFLDEEVVPPLVGGSEVLVAAGTGPLIVDLATGATRPPAKDEAFWCGREVTFDYREARPSADAASSSHWRGGTLFNPCTATGSPATASPSSVPTSLGTTVGDRTVLGTDRGLVAYDHRRQAS